MASIFISYLKWIVFKQICRQWRDTPHSPKLQDWSITIRCSFESYPGKLGGILSLRRGYNLHYSKLHRSMDSISSYTQAKYKSWTRLFLFYFMLISLGKAQTLLFFLQLRVNIGYAKKEKKKLLEYVYKRWKHHIP